MQVDTHKNGHTVCLIFGWDSKEIKSQLVDSNPWTLDLSFISQLEKLLNIRLQQVFLNPDHANIHLHQQHDLFGILLFSYRYIIKLILIMNYVQKISSARQKSYLVSKSRKAYTGHALLFLAWNQFLSLCSNIWWEKLTLLKSWQSVLQQKGFKQSFLSKSINFV